MTTRPNSCCSCSGPERWGRGGKTDLSLDVTEGATPSGSETILLVEDEPMILEMVTAMLQRQGYQVLIAATPGEALRLDAEVQFIQKPFSMKALSGKVREVLDGD
jgi:hypothetical protein